MVKGRDSSATGEWPAEAVEVADRFAEMAEQGVGEIHRQPVAHDDALDCEIGQVSGHRIRGHDPATLAKLIAQVIQVPLIRVTGLQMPGEDRDVRGVVPELEWRD